MIGKLTPTEQIAHDKVLLSASGIGCGKAQPNASAGSASGLHKDDNKAVSKSPAQLPLDLSILAEPKPENPTLMMPLDLSFTSVSDPQDIGCDTPMKTPNDELEEEATQDNLLTPSPPVKIKEKWPSKASTD